MSRYTVYMAGPMTGLPQFNFPAFDALAASLRSAGYAVISPSELDDPEDRAAALASPDGYMHGGHHMNKTWGDFLARDVKLIADGPIDGIVILPRWETSRGARLETFVGRMLCGKAVYRWDATYEVLRKVSMLELAKGWLGIGLSFHSIHEFDRDAVGGHR